MKRVVDVLYGLKGYPNAARFAEFKTDLFANGGTGSISIDAGVTTGLSTTGNLTNAIRVVSGTVTNAITLSAVATVTNLFNFNAVAGCVGAADVACDGEPSAGGLGADGHIVIAIGATPYYIPIFNSLVG